MTFADLIAQWPSTAEFSRDLGVTIDLASKWRRERGVPSHWWGPMLAAAKGRGIDLTAEMLIEAERRSKAERAA